MGEQPLFEMVAFAGHVRPALSTARNDAVAGDEQGNLARKRRGEKSAPKKSVFTHTEKFMCVFFKGMFAS